MVTLSSRSPKRTSTRSESGAPGARRIGTLMILSTGKYNEKLAPPIRYAGPPSFCHCDRPFGSIFDVGGVQCEVPHAPASGRPAGLPPLMAATCASGSWPELGSRPPTCPRTARKRMTPPAPTTDGLRDRFRGIPARRCRSHEPERHPARAGPRSECRNEDGAQQASRRRQGRRCPVRRGLAESCYAHFHSGWRNETVARGRRHRTTLRPRRMIRSRCRILERIAPS